MIGRTKADQPRRGRWRLPILTLLSALTVASVLVSLVSALTFLPSNVGAQVPSKNTTLAGQVEGADKADGAGIEFSGSRAAAYADRYATQRNSNYPSFGSDCTNFSSQALHDGAGGGYPFRESGSNQWWVRRTLLWWNYTNSWSVVRDNWTFLIRDWPGGWDWGYQPTNRNTNSALYGDLLFYDWDGNGTLDHTGIEVAYSGCDPANRQYCGDLQDQHTTDRYHAIWHLSPYNSQRGTTKVKLMHIDSGN